MLAPGDDELALWYIGDEEVGVDAVLGFFVMIDACRFAYRCEAERALDVRCGTDLDHAVALFVHSHKDEWLVLSEHVSVDDGTV